MRNLIDIILQLYNILDEICLDSRQNISNLLVEHDYIFRLLIKDEILFEKRKSFEFFKCFPEDCPLRWSLENI